MEEGMTMMKEWRRLPALAALGIFVTLLVFWGCAQTRQVLTRDPAPEPPALEGRWDLAEYGPVGTPVPVLPDTRVYVEFMPEGKVSGSGGCNRYSGGWGFVEGEPGVLRIWRTGSTKMACPVPVMIQEHRFLEELSRVSGYSTDGQELRLFHDGGKGVLRFVRGGNP